jgi:hypothetical protein
MCRVESDVLERFPQLLLELGLLTVQLASFVATEESS